MRKHVHDLYHKFTSRMGNNVTGSDAMDLAEEFADRNKDMFVVRVADSLHANSDLCLIPHADKEEYRGTSVWFIPQCTGERGEFFLYPQHLDKLIEALTEIKNRQRKNPTELDKGFA